MKFKEIGTECGGGALNISCGAHNRSFWAEDLGATQITRSSATARENRRTLSCY